MHAHWGSHLGYMSFRQTNVESLVQISEIVWEEFEKVGLRHFVNLQNKKAWPISRDSAQFSECVDIRFLNVQQSICEL